MGSIPVDIAGERFGHLVAIKPTGNSIKGRGREWECKCDCGNLFYATPTQLRAGNNVSCGCLILQGQKAVRYEPQRDCVSCMRSEDDYKCKQSERMESPYGTNVHCHRWNMTVDYDGYCYEGY